MTKLGLNWILVRPGLACNIHFVPFYQLLRWSQSHWYG